MYDCVLFVSKKSFRNRSSAAQRNEKTRCFWVRVCVCVRREHNARAYHLGCLWQRSKSIFLLSPLFRTRTLIASFLDLFYILMNFLSFNCWMKVWRWYVLICLYMDATRFFPSQSFSLSFPPFPGLKCGCVILGDDDVAYVKRERYNGDFWLARIFGVNFTKEFSLQTTHICILRGCSRIFTSFHQLSESLLQRGVCETFSDAFFSLLDFDDVLFWKKSDSCSHTHEFFFQRYRCNTENISLW